MTTGASVSPTRQARASWATTTRDTFASVSVPGAANSGFAYHYDADGNIKDRVYPDSNTATFTYNADGNPTSQRADGVTVGYSFDAAGEYTGSTVPATDGSGNPAATTALAYDNAGHMTGITDTRGTAVTGAWQLTLDASGEPAQDKIVHGAVNATVTYGYDHAGRLTSACPATGTGGLCTSGSGELPVSPMLPRSGINNSGGEFVRRSCGRH